MLSEGIETPKLEQLVRVVAPGSRLLRAWNLKGGISAGMTAVEIEHPGGEVQRLVVRQPGAATLHSNPRAAEDEFRLLQVAHSAGLSAPAPVYLDQSGAIFPAPYLVVEYVEGAPEFTPSKVENFARQLAEHLAAIHSVGGSHHDLAFLPELPTACAECVCALPAPPDELPDEGRIRDALKGVTPLGRNAPALLHGDFWPGNCLWRNGRLVAVIDWEDAARGDPLVDLAISRLDLLWICGLEAMQSFMRHYHARMPIDYADLPYWDLCAALRLARLVRQAGANLDGWAAFFHPYGRRDITAQTIREHYRLFVDQALSILERRD
jgi:aminoglycoside phosphotransferase (APT) family kinase protein